MKVAIVGYGVEGKSAEAYWRAKGDEVSICDTDSDLTGYDLLVRSPGVHPSKLPAGALVTSVTNEFMQQCPAPIFGVTGTKGKGTTVSLLAEMLRAGGKTVHVGGNIGVPALDLLSNVKPDDIAVLELSSFQLMDVARSPHVAVCLMIAPEHLDYHADEAEYVTAKGNIFAHQTPDDVAVYNVNDQNAVRLAQLSVAASKVPYDVTGAEQAGAYVQDGNVYYQDQLICSTQDIALPGKHNWQNVCAAVAAAVHEDVDTEALASAIRNFKGLPYRLEEVATVNDVRFVNDSISTTPESAIAALQAYTEPKVMILGGSDKGIQFDDLAKEITNGNVSGVVTIGETGAAIASALSGAGYAGTVVADVPSMAEAVQQAKNLCEPNGVVLLSPACASFGMFKNYKDRGDQFNLAVQSLR